jgi:hypothetical protein
MNKNIIITFTFLILLLLSSFSYALSGGIVGGGGSTNNNYFYNNMSIGSPVNGSTNSSVLFVDGTGKLANSAYFKYYMGQLNLTSVGGSTPLLVNGNATITGNLSVQNLVPYTNATSNVNLNGKNLTNVGNVGIGTTAPATNLDVSQALDGGKIRVSSAQSDTNHSATVPHGSFEVYSADGSGGGAGVRGAVRVYPASSGGASSFMTFSNRDSTSLELERMRLDWNGNIGMGTTTPLTPLHIVYPALKTNTSSVAVLTLSSNDSTPSTNASKLTISSTGDASTQNNRQWNLQSSISSTNAGNLNLQPLGGNVGIGTTTPAQKLDVNGSLSLSGNLIPTTQVLKIQSATTDGYTSFQVLPNGAGTTSLFTTYGTSNSNQAGYLSFGSSGTISTGRNGNVSVPDMRFVVNAGTNLTAVTAIAIPPTGNVGIGTTNPTTKLEVSQTITPDGLTPTKLRISGVYAGDWTANTEMGSLEFYNTDTSVGGANVRGKISSITQDIYGFKWALGFYTATNNSAPTEKMRIMDNGDVGIGTTTPTVKLATHDNNATFSTLVIGSGGTSIANFADNVNAVSGIQMGNINNGTSADFRFLIKDTTDHYFAFAQPSINNSQTLFGLNRKTTDYIFNAGGTVRDMSIGTGQDSFLTLVTNLTERMRITNTGNVGIGTTAPVSQLEVFKSDSTATFGNANGAITLRNPETINAVGSRGYTGIDFAGVLTTDAGTYGGIYGVVTGSGASGQVGSILFGTKSSIADTSLTERMIITNTGNVGIGTIAPTSKLDVNGTINSKANYQINGTNGITQTITILKDVDFLGMLKTYCNVTYTGGIVTNTTC